MLRLACLLSLLLLAAGCGRDAPPAPQAPAVPDSSTDTAGAPAGAAAADLADVIENDPRYLVGISYAPGLDAHPGLASALKGYADAARAELMEAVDGLGDTPPTSPYDLSLAFTMLMDTPRVVAVAADGSSYTGGAHGNPLVARFVWLPERQAMLRADALLGDAAGWRAVSSFVREQLHAALSQRIDADELEPTERAQLMRSAGRLIDEGSEPDHANFAQFEPMAGPDGRLGGLRFVFPPYQVGPYSDGVHTVEVPASVLLPHLAPAHRDLFVADPQPAR